MWKCYFITSLKLYCQGWVSSTIIIDYYILIVIIIGYSKSHLSALYCRGCGLLHWWWEDQVLWPPSAGETIYWLFHFSTIKYSIFTFHFQVEYYQLNHGCLPVRLLHYLSCSPAPAGGVLQLWWWNYVDGKALMCWPQAPNICMIPGEKEKETEVCSSPPSRSSSPTPPRWAHLNHVLRWPSVSFSSNSIKQIFLSLCFLHFLFTFPGLLTGKETPFISRWWKFFQISSVAPFLIFCSGQSHGTQSRWQPARPQAKQIPPWARWSSWKTSFIFTKDFLPRKNSLEKCCFLCTFPQYDPFVKMICSNSL